MIPVIQEYPLLRVDPLLTDIDNKESILECCLCDNSDALDSHNAILWWYEYHPSVHSAKSKKICDHCLFPPPRNIDFVMCGQEKHLYCLYCIELKLFRVQLGRFVMEPDDNEDLGIQWERDYVIYRRAAGSLKHNKNQLNCLCFGKKDDFFTDSEDTTRSRAGTTRLAGYKAQKDTFHQNIEMQLSNPNPKKQKKNINFLNKKKDENKNKNKNQNQKIIKKDDENKDNNDNDNHLVDEAELDDMYQDDFEVNNDDGNVIFENNKKKQKAVELLLAACVRGNRQPPSVIIELNYDKYAVYCYSYTMAKLELKQRAFLFDTLEFISMVAPTIVIIQLIYEYKKQILMLPYKRIDKLLLAIIRGSKYSIATSLKMASLAQEFADVDLSAKDMFLKLKEKYEAIAIELIKEIESGHLAAILLETPSDIDSMTPLDIAFEYRLFNFLSQSKIEKIAHQVWIERYFLNPRRIFEVSDIDSWDVLFSLSKSPHNFYFQPLGKHIIKTFLFFSYLFMFSYILTTRPSIYDIPEPIEIIFWLLNIGYFTNEIYEAFGEDGLANYLTSWTNYVDMSISINFATQILLRCIWIFKGIGCDNLKINNSSILYNYNTGLPLGSWKKCPTTEQISSGVSLSGYWRIAGCTDIFENWPYLSDSVDDLCSFNSTYQENAQFLSSDIKCSCWKQFDRYLSNSCCRSANTSEAVLFNFLYGLNAILLWMRSLYFAEQNSTLGPLIKIVLAMRFDFANYLQLTLLFMIGFSFAIRSFIGTFSQEFSTIPSTILYMFKSTFGKIDFSVLESCGDGEDDLCKDGGWISFWRSNLVQVLIMTYLIVALIMIRLLIAMISFTYNKKIKQATHEVIYQKIKNAYELDKSSGLIPPPLNIIVFALYIIWLIMDILMVILINRYIDVENHLNLAKPCGSSYIKRVYNGIQDLFSRNTSYWICLYCRHHNSYADKYDINNYLTQFRPSCDPADAKIIEVYAPIICENCYRGKSDVGRMTLVLQQISFAVFMFSVYIPLFVVIFIPAIISWFAEWLSDKSDSDNEDLIEENTSDSPQQLLKRHQTIAGAHNLQAKRPRSLSKQSPEYKLKKKKQKEEKKKKERIKKAKKYAILRQIQQLNTQLDAVPNPDTTHKIKNSLKNIIKSNNGRLNNKKNSIITPNINEIVDEVTSDKTPITKLQQNVQNLNEIIHELYELVKASQTFSIASTLQNIKSSKSNNKSDNKSDKSDKSDNDDDIIPIKKKKKKIIKNKKNKNKKKKKKKNKKDTIEFAQKAVNQLQKVLLKSTNSANRQSSRSSGVVISSNIHKSHNSQKISGIYDKITKQMLDDDDDDDNNNNNNNSSFIQVETMKNRFSLRPSDTLKHKNSYKKKSKLNLLIDDNDNDDDTSDDDDDDNDDNDDNDYKINIEEEEEQDDKNNKNKNVHSPKKSLKLKDELSDDTSTYLENILNQVDKD